MNFILYDGVEWKKLFPITLTRPVSEIRLGLFTMKERWEKYLGKNVENIITQSFLSKKYSQKESSYFKDILLINSSFLPNEELIQILFSLKENEGIFFENKIIAFKKTNFFFKKEDILSFPLEKYKKIYYVKKVIHIQYPWDIFINNEIVLKKDFMFFTKGKKSFSLEGKNHIICKDKIFLEENIKANNVVLNAQLGPIYIEKGVKIMEGSVIIGPVSIGKNSILNIGSKIYGGTTISTFCKVGGEIFNSVIFSYSNKVHDGFLGNSVLGEWCNLGAGTNVSNLRNDYQKVTVWNYEKKDFFPINLQFFGMIMGDHSRSAINTQFNTATIVGVSDSIFGYGFSPRYIPSFFLGGIQRKKKFLLIKFVIQLKL
ncbi:Nucleotidyl Transferase [Blattabacterium sp. (Nauphoeta cinerea)]|uniref:putative sugar nucleotidyl transferase n=1 Tax=Blattabacterium sp. (Nauphoeta cinerea) TaxID=1316444 RepID=UPI0003B03076|nr:putative sugar nucleotidyl transferase [Blattabacterium sp. (Nauphoeta cinerea)]AGW85892.1 Nucleotidyl Transferase [Blattabacterium sp. (Nauphoeta cinerea)]